jgi:hypothetical protein
MPYCAGERKSNNAFRSRGGLGGRTAQAGAGSLDSASHHAVDNRAQQTVTASRHSLYR